MLKSVKCS